MYRIPCATGVAADCWFEGALLYFPLFKEYFFEMQVFDKWLPYSTLFDCRCEAVLFGGTTYIVVRKRRKPGEISTFLKMLRYVSMIGTNRFRSLRKLDDRTMRIKFNDVRG